MLNQRQVNPLQCLWVMLLLVSGTPVPLLAQTPAPMCPLPGSPCNPTDSNTQPSVNGASGAGNPIDVTTGNKYVLATDLAWSGAFGDSGLAFHRHYNSFGTASSDLGPGWSHGLDTRLTRYQHGESASPTIRIKQSDGREIVFEAVNDAIDGVRTYVSKPAGYGIVEERSDDVRRLLRSPNALNRASLHDLSVLRPWTWRWLDGKRFEFDARGLPAKIVDVGGASTVLTYDVNHRLSGVRDAYGRKISLAYWDDASARLPQFGSTATKRDLPARGRLRSLRTPEGAEIQYFYDNQGMLSSVSYPDKTFSRYEYSVVAGIPRLTRVVGRDGRTIGVYAYDTSGRSVRSEGEAGAHRIELEYLGARNGSTLNETWVRNSLGHVSVYRWQRSPVTGDPQLVEAIGPGCAACARTGVRYVYDAAGRLSREYSLSRVDPRTENKPRVLSSRSMSYDRFGRLLELTSQRDGRSDLVERRRYVESLSVLGPVSIERPSIAPGKHHAVVMTYSAAGLLSVVSERGYRPDIRDGKTQFVPIVREVRLGYDEVGRLVSVDGPSAGDFDRVRIEYASDGLVAVLRYPEGVSETFNYDQFGRIKSRTAQDGVPWAYRYARSDSRYLVSPQPHVVARYNLVSKFAFTPEGSIAAYESEQGDSYSLSYDSVGRLSRITDSTGVRVDLEFDSDGNRTGERVSAPASGQVVTRSSRFQYNAYRELSAYADSAGTSVRIDYDDAGDLLSVGDSGAAPLAVVGASNAGTAAFMRRYEATDQLITQFAFGRSFEIRPESMSIVGVPDRPVIDEVNEQQPKTEHAGQHLLARARAALSADWSELWASRSARFETVHGANGDVSGFLFDDFGRLVRSFAGDTGVESLYYGATDEPVRVCRDNGTCEELTYDGLSRPTSIVTTNAAGAKEETVLRYAGLHLQELRNDEQTTTYRFDILARLVERVDRLAVGEYRHGWTFDEHGRLAEQLLPDGSRVVLVYSEGSSKPHSMDIIDRDSRRRSLLQKIEHSFLDSFTQVRFGNGLYKSKQFDANGRLVRLVHGAPYGRAESGGVIRSASASSVAPQWRDALTYEATGMLQSIDRLGKQYPLQTDFSGRLLSFGQGDDSEAFAYDDAGNLVTLRGSHKEIAIEYEPRSNRMAQYGGQAVEHDLAGNVTLFSGMRLSYGANNRLENVVLPTGALVDYGYNSLGERTRRVVSSASGTTRDFYLYSDNRLHAEVSDDGTVTGMFIFLGDEPIAKVEHEARSPWLEHAPRWLVRMIADEPRILFIHTDGVGTPVLATNELQQTVWSATYTAYGLATVSPDASVTINLRFAGQYYDDLTKLHYNYLRDYAPAAGRYLQPDPVGLPGGLNLYEYAGSNPLAATDPQGTSIASWILKKGATRIVARQIREYIRDVARGRVATIVRRWADRGMNVADQFGEMDEIIRILDSANGFGVWDIVGLVPVIGDAIDIGRSYRQLCRVKDLLKSLDRKLIGFDRLPVTRGSWSRGRPGNGNWMPGRDSPAYRATGGRAIVYRDGFPDFTPFTYRDARGRLGQVNISLSGDSARDIAEARRAMRQRYPDWQEPANHTWHHDTQCGRMILVSTAINAIPHAGGDAIHRQGLC
jgi:RHS repeat-associated protein